MHHCTLLTMCLQFQPISTAFSMLGHYDMILGMNACKRPLLLWTCCCCSSFLRRVVRNFYTLFDYGNFVSDTSNDRGDPYVQLLPLTDRTAALADFAKIRQNGTGSSSSNVLLPASQESHSPVSAAEKKQHLEGAVARNWPYIFVGCLAFVLSVLGCCVYACCCRKRRNKGARLFSNPYQAIHEPPPPPMHMRPISSGGQYADPYRPRP